MRELERDTPPTPEAAPRSLPDSPCLAIVGGGRLGSSLAETAREAGMRVTVAGRDHTRRACAGADLVLLCVPDTEIGAACEAAAGAEPLPSMVGHSSGATGLEALGAAAGAGAATFSLHPLQTFAGAGADPRGAHCAIAGSDAAALAAAAELAERLGMSPFEVPEATRAAYHAAAAIASNFLVALEEAATELMRAAGVEEDARELLAPLVLRTAANWSESGADALSGPIARGDDATVERHRAAIAELAPELAGMYEAMAERTRIVAGVAP
jgi:predicted short-subunit dehydrogenase-like oxidoreductase (DUF2520 family)